MRRARELMSDSFGPALRVCAWGTGGEGTAGTGTRVLWGVLRAFITPGGSRRPRVRAPHRLLRAVVAGFVAVVLVATTTAVVGAESGSVTVRVAARKLATDRVEFAVQQQVGDAWSERQLPTRRLFPADTAVGRWLVSSAIEAGAVTLRVTAQKVADGRIEFAVQQRNGDTWGQRQLPTRRFFPADTAVGRWLVSSPVTLNVNGSQSSSAAGAAAASGSDCVPLPDDVPQYTRERLCLPEVGDNTFRVFYGPGNYDYEPLPIRVGSRLEFYSTRVGGGTDMFYTVVKIKELYRVRRGSVAGYKVDVCMDKYIWNVSENPDAPHYVLYRNVLTEVSMRRSQDGYYTASPQLGIKWRGSCQP